MDMVLRLKGLPVKAFSVSWETTPVRDSKDGSGADTGSVRPAAESEEGIKLSSLVAKELLNRSNAEADTPNEGFSRAKHCSIKKPIGRSKIVFHAQYDLRDAIDTIPRCNSGVADALLSIVDASDVCLGTRHRSDTEIILRTIFFMNTQSLE